MSCFDPLRLIYLRCGEIHNLAHRPAKPALHAGRIQRAVKHLFYVQATVTTTQVAQSGYVEGILLRGKRLQPSDYRHCRRARGPQHADQSFAFRRSPSPMERTGAPGGSMGYLVLDQLLGPTVQEADMRVDALDDFTV
jgi:hypothetical protein